MVHWVTQFGETHGAHLRSDGPLVVRIQIIQNET